jgi:hypothetical protein
MISSPDEIMRPIAVAIPRALRSLIPFAISRVKESVIIRIQSIVFHENKSIVLSQ